MNTLISSQLIQQDQFIPRHQIGTAVEEVDLCQVDEGDNFGASAIVSSIRN